ncbi:hypothetical protein PC41400_14785 [Paenibacillus chitinolyticus]|uniref:Accessory gene regulator B family protein n=1 Tax=Paenibacillus chitinolyticus TaxID=79263 RepID=A0A410WWS9_9BACL|nr:accessory gene regulator B family protein [Paenibacillus chitinolyticus]MCY9592392.1 accessory gene regulator B family protein [Paenibacillus chitinolyticus]MCY9599853.1 accessory gene regulator B family protein [Paenibacillus chitinolyticus]QAV18875.1 hypothetical protein PC41400_14785 [Paenibacillus chitinolyticus]
MCDLLRTTILKVDNGRSGGRLVYYLAETLTDWILNKDTLNKLKKDELERGLKKIINFGLIILLVLILSVVTNRVIETLLGMVLLGVMRAILGGHHLPSSDLCVLYTVTLIIVIPYIGHAVDDYKLLMDSLSFFLIILFGPFRKGMSFNKNFLLYKIIGLIIVTGNIYIYRSAIISAAIFIQAIHLIYFTKGVHDNHVDCG